MSKLTKKDFDDYLGGDSFYSKEDKKRFYRNLQPSNKWKRHWLPQTLTAVFVFGLFIVGIQFYQGNIPIVSTGDDDVTDANPKEKTDWSDWIKADSIKDIDDFYESAIPGYKIAKELNQIVEVYKKYSLTDNVSLYIDSVWYHEDKIHLFYSLDLSEEELVKNNWDTGILYEFLLHADNDSKVNLKIDTPIRWSGVVFDNAFNNKLYRVSTITLEEENQLSGKEQLTTSFTIDAHNEEVTLSYVTLPVSYGSEEITSNGIYRAYHTLHSDITFRRYDSGAGKGYLFGGITSKLGQELEALHGKISLNNGDSISLTDRIVFLNESDFVIDIPELASENVIFEFDYLSMLEKEDTIDISIDVSDYDISDAPVEQIMNQGIDEVNNINIFLRSIVFDNHGVKIGISTENARHAQIQFYSTFFPEMYDLEFPNVLSAIDNNGEEAKEHHFLPIGNELGSEIHTFGLTKNFIKDKDQIDIQIKKISFGEDFHWTIEIPKKD